jgi:hypothetical protein
MINPWTSTPSILNSVLDLFYSTNQLIDTTDTTAVKTAKLQLSELAKIIFQSFNERLEWLGRCAYYIVQSMTNTNRTQSNSS